MNDAELLDIAMTALEEIAKSDHKTGRELMAVAQKALDEIAEIDDGRILP